MGESLSSAPRERESPSAVARKAPNPATDAKIFLRSRPSGVVEPMCSSLAEKRSMTVVQHRLGPGPLDVRDRGDIARLLPDRQSTCRHKPTEILDLTSEVLGVGDARAQRNSRRTCPTQCATLPQSVALGRSENSCSSGYSARNLLEVRRRRMESGKTAQGAILAPSPSSSFPDVQFLIVVSFKETDLYEHLSKTFAGVRRLKVIMEHRHGDRRRQRQDVAVERREWERRLHRGQVSALGYTAVRLPRSSQTRCDEALSPDNR